MSTSIYEAYKWNNLALVEAFANAAARLGVSSSGLAIYVMGLDDRKTFDFLKTVLRARLDGHSPPFDREAKVKAIKPYCPHKIFGDPALWFTPGTKHELKEGDVCTVHSMHYQSDGTWMVVLREHEINRSETYFLYDAKDLAPVT